MYRKILVPIDGSPTSDKALDEAIALARLTDGRLYLLHVVEEIQYVNGFESPCVYLDDVVPFMRKTAERLLARAVHRATEADVTADGSWVMGGREKIWEHVNEHVRRLDADLIVLGSHGRRGVERLLMGSDAEQIVRCAPVPVLVVKNQSGPI